MLKKKISLTFSRWSIKHEQQQIIILTYVIIFDLVASSTSLLLLLLLYFCFISKEEIQIEHTQYNRYRVHYIDWLFKCCALVFFHKISFSKLNYRFISPDVLSEPSTYWLCGKRISHFYLEMRRKWKKNHLYNCAFSTWIFCMLRKLKKKKWKFNFGSFWGTKKKTRPYLHRI